MSQVVQAASPSIVCLQETKMETITVDVVRHCLGNKFENFFYLPAVGTRGGILVAWDTSVVNLSNPHHTTYTLTALVKPSEGPQWWLTGVYGPQLDQEKLDFLQEQVDIRDLHAGPWMVVGDFNLLVNPEDKSNDRINRRMLARFRAKLNMLELKELYLNGRRYTWSNERARATLEKVDHVFCTPSWRTCIQNAASRQLALRFLIIAHSCWTSMRIYAWGSASNLKLFGQKQMVSWIRWRMPGGPSQVKVTHMWCWTKN